MKISFLLSTLLLAVSSLTLTGCGVIYSDQNYGSPHYHIITEDSTKSEVLANYGLPNAVYRSDFRDGETREAFVYKKLEGINVLGIYSKIEREDTVVIFDTEDTVIYVGTVNQGKGQTILSNPIFESTHPVRPDELLFDPENYGYDAYWGEENESGE